MNRFPPVRSILALAFLPLLSTASCSDGGGSAGDDPRVVVGGIWQGTWESSIPGPSGSLTLHLDQEGASVTGTGLVDGHACFADCTVDCKVKGEELMGWLDAGQLRMAIHGSCSGHHHDVLTGIYEIHDGACGGEEGTIHLTRVSNEGQGVPDAGGVPVGEVILIGPERGDLARLPVIVRQ